MFRPAVGQCTHRVFQASLTRTSSNSSGGMVGRRIVDYRRACANTCKAAGFVYRVVNEKTGRRELGRRMHDLRRTAADDGTPERVVMAMTGHKTRAMFDCYSIAITTDVETALRRAPLPAAGNPVGRRGTR